MVAASTMTSDRRIPLRSRLLALVLGVFFAVQPVARAGVSCNLRSGTAGRARSACCCRMDGALVAEGVATLPCCASRMERSPGGGRAVQRRTCGCELNVPTPGDALPRSVDPRSSNADSSAGAAEWIAEGARVSAAVPWLPVADPPDERSVPPPDLGLSASREGRLSAPDAVARSCARGVNGLLAVLGSALL